MKNHFEGMSDSRQAWKTEHNLHEIVIMTIIAIMSGFDIWEDIADYCRVQADWFRNKMGLKLENGVASHDTFQRIFQIIKPTELERCFRLWVSSVVEMTEGEIVGIDGKTSRGSRDKKRKAIHMVSAWATANRVVLGQIKTADKSNEITAIPTLIELLELKGCIVTIDAAGCQTKIVEAIVDAEADYVIGLKGNQKKLLKKSRDYFENDEIKAQEFTTENTGHGREETRKYFLVTDIGNLPNKEKWKNLNALGMVKSSVFEKGKLREETRYFITSLTNVEIFAKAVRSHWGIENSLHWCLDVAFNEDKNRTRKDNSPENIAVIRHFALSALNLHPAKISLARKRRKCQYDYDFLLEVFALID
jgi:predicted transposase YbfD/YdcC